MAVSADLGMTRRAFVGRSVRLAAGLSAASPWLAAAAAQPPACGEVAGELVRTLPLYGPGASDWPLGTVLGRGLDARRFTDLSGLDSGRMTTPTGELFVRTDVPDGLSLDPATWAVDVLDQAGARLTRVTAAELVRLARPCGEHVIECAGNSNPQNFGLMSAATWRGVPLAEVLARVPRPDGATAILVSGRDHTEAGSPQSLPGASWILPVAEIDRRAPFLAVGVNDDALPPIHGAPVRLAVPGWYGCSWIKWVDRLQWVGGDARPTTQMLEFAFRTHQDGIPARVDDYLAPEIDLAAMPVRVEQRRVGGRIEYRVVGIVWGGAARVDRLLLRFASRDPGVPVTICDAEAPSRPWRLWSHRWRPTDPGYYDLTLKSADPSVRTRRLDLSFYLRRVRIDEVSPPAD